MDRDERYRFLNAPFERAHGLEVDAALGRTMRDVHGEALCAQLAPHVSLALHGQKTSFDHTEQIDGRERHFRSDYIPATDAAGQPDGFYALSHDITDLKETQARLELLTMVDPLTGLPNRRRFDERLRDAMARTRRTMRSMAVMIIDLDHLKALNDRHGSGGGDAVLCEVARRLVGRVRSTDTVVRLAGDEFAVILEAIDGVLELGRLADAIVAGMRERLQHDGQAIAITISVGVSIYRGGRQSASDLLAAADDALRRARQQGRDRFVLA
ncbi:MAG: GGDEF domain-containing protein [Burkholderiaceae bacterium]